MANTTIPSELIQADVALGGSPTTTTQSAGNNTTKLATTAFVTTAVNNLIASAPGTMDTLNEIAAALNDDPDFTTTVNNAIATKLPLAGGTMTGNLIVNASLDISGDIDVDGTTNLDVVDIDGPTNISGAVTITAALVANSGVIFNEGSADVDFRVESNGNANMLFVDGGNDTVGIGTSSPVAKLDIHMSDSNGDYGRGRDGNLNLENTNTSVTEGGWLSISGYMGNSASGGQYQMGYISGGKQTTAADGDYGGYLTLWTTSGGANGEANSGGYERMRIDASGNVGIGTDSPQEKLHIFNSLQSWNQYANIRMSTESDSYAAEIGFHRGTSDDSDRGLFLSGDGTNKHVRILHGGNVGIGTTSPTEKLHISGSSASGDITARIVNTDTSSATSYASVSLVGGNNEASIRSIHGTGGAGALAFYNENAERMRIDSSGAVIVNNSGGDAQIYLGGSSGTSRMYLARTGSDAILWNVSGGNLRFGNNNVERMRIDSSGDVLIGQTSQTGYAFAQKLVVGDGDNNDGITIQSGSTHQGNLAFNHSDGTTAHGRISYQHGTNYMQFFTNNTERMRIESTGVYLQEGNYDYHNKVPNFTQSLSSYSSSTNVAYTENTIDVPGKGEKLLCQTATRGFTNYVHLKTNLISNNIMFYFRTRGYTYNTGMEEHVYGGYTYNGTVIATEHQSVYGSTHTLHAYRGTSGHLCFRIHVNTTSYNEGKVHVFFGSHTSSVIRELQVTDVKQRDDGNNAF